MRGFLLVVLLPLCSCFDSRIESGFYTGSIVAFTNLKPPVVLRRGRPKLEGGWTVAEAELLRKLEDAFDACDDATAGCSASAGHSLLENSMAGVAACSASVCKLQEIRAPNDTETIDDLSELGSPAVKDMPSSCERTRTSQRTLVTVAISGGGARAAVLAAHVLADLERHFNELADLSGYKQESLFEAIDAFSTVSGGSLFAHHLAVAQLRTKEVRRLGSRVESTDGPRSLFDTLRSRPADLELESLTNVGKAAFWQQFIRQPFALIENLTELGYVDDLAEGLIASAHGYRAVYARWDKAVFLGQLPRRPRYFFNATSLESGAPFIMSQRMHNLRRSPLRATPLRYGRPRLSEPADLARPFDSALTLEDIGWTPRGMPLAFAAAVSAAFPIGIEPARLARYDYSFARRQSYATTTLLTLADGGIYDNSGLLTLVNWFESLAMNCVVDRLILIHIDADTTEYEGDVAVKAAPAALADGLTLEPVPPLPSLWSLFTSVNLIHFVNKRRGEMDALHRLGAVADRLFDDNAARGARSELPTDSGRDEVVAYFPLSIRQIPEIVSTGADSGFCAPNLFGEVRHIPTNLGIPQQDERWLEKAAECLSRGRRRDPWSGVRCANESQPRDVFRWKDAVALAILRARHPEWETSLPAAIEQRFCATAS